MSVYIARGTAQPKCLFSPLIVPSLPALLAERCDGISCQCLVRSVFKQAKGSGSRCLSGFVVARLGKTISTHKRNLFNIESVQIKSKRPAYRILAEFTIKLTLSSTSCIHERKMYWDDFPRRTQWSEMYTPMRHLCLFFDSSGIVGAQSAMRRHSTITKNVLINTVIWLYVPPIWRTGPGLRSIHIDILILFYQRWCANVYQVPPTPTTTDAAMRRNTVITSK